MDDKRRNDGSPNRRGQNGSRQQGAQNGRRQQAQNDRRQQGEQDGPPQQGESGRNLHRVDLGPRITPDRRTGEWVNYVDAQDEPPIEDPDNQGLGDPGRGIGQGPHPHATGFIGNGQPPGFPPAMPHGISPHNYMGPRLPPMASAPGPRSFGPSHQPHGPPWTNTGAGALNFSQLGGLPQPMHPSLGRNRSSWPAAGAYLPPGQIVQAAGNSQPRAQAPGNTQPCHQARSNAATNTPAVIQQPGDGQSSRKRAAGEEPAGQKPAPKKQAGRGFNGDTVGEGPPKDQLTKTKNAPYNPANNAIMSISERLDKGLITDVAGLTREEGDEVAHWARGKGMPWKVIQKKFKFQISESTLRGRERKLVSSRAPRKPEVTERDTELLLDAVERINGRQLDDVNNHKTKALWTKAKADIRENGAETTAGEATLKKHYASLIENKRQTREDLKPRKSKQKAKNYNDQRQKEASSDDNEKDEPIEKSSTHGGGASTRKLSKLEWDHSEYEKYDVEFEEGADFGETKDNEDEKHDEHDENEVEDENDEDDEHDEDYED